MEQVVVLVNKYARRIYRERRAYGGQRALSLPSRLLTGQDGDHADEDVDEAREEQEG